MDTLLTIAKVAELLSCSRTTINRLMSSGKLPFVKVTGDAIRIKASDVTAFYERNSQTAKASK
jgi:excisionase family DNA binding protein